jgi:Na+/proline symporter
MSGDRMKARLRRSLMKKNIGTVERIVRVVVGIGILSLAFVGPRSPWAYLGVLPLLSGAVGWCPPYALLGISTVREPDKIGRRIST